MNIKFGTDGWRGIIARDFTFQNVRTVTQAICDYLLSTTNYQPSTILVGYDCRFLSREFAQASAAVLQGNGFKVLLADNPVPTPVVSFNVVKRKASGAIVITASHNPYQFNGLKVKSSEGASASPEVTREFEKRIKAAQVRYTVDQVQEMNFDQAYFSHISDLVDMSVVKKKKIRVCIDPLFGTARGYLEALLKHTSLHIVSDNNWRDPLFGGLNPEPIAHNMSSLMQAVKKEKAAIGIALDGDADRVGMVDSQGVFVNSHQIFSLLLLHLIKNKKQKGTVVKTISGTYLIEKICRKYDLTLRETSIGFKYIGDLMLKEDVLIGGEESGGIGFRGHIPERDGILSALYMLELMAFSGKDLAHLRDEMFNEFGTSCYDRVDLALSAPLNKNEFTGQMKTEIAHSSLSQEVSAFKDYDGLKTILSDGSWLLLRPSGTEPMVRIYAESDRKTKVKKLIDLGYKLVYKLQKKTR